jgi:ATP-dependent protease ClpP protease subunit
MLLDEIKTTGSPFDVIRRKYLAKLFTYTRRNVIVYYSGWLQKQGLIRQGILGYSVDDEDKTGFMSAIHQMDRTKGLDLILHTPGGDIAAAESLVEYLRSMFGRNIRVIIPQMAMSAGTMIACASDEIILGRHSSIGPIDPQVNGIPAHGVIEEFNRALSEITTNNIAAAVWQPIIAKYNPTLIGECEKVIKWSEEIVHEWLVTGMFADDEDKEAKADRVVRELGDHALTKSHNRHYSIQHARDIGLKVSSLEEDSKLQDLVLSVHHACMLTLDGTPAIKIIENHKGVALIKSVSQG